MYKYKVKVKLTNIFIEVNELPIDLNIVHLHKFITFLIYVMEALIHCVIIYVLITLIVKKKKKTNNLIHGIFYNFFSTLSEAIIYKT